MLSNEKYTGDVELLKSGQSEVFEAVQLEKTLKRLKRIEGDAIMSDMVYSKYVKH